ncbi:hypothetical protein LR48_Vigan04g044400 [Vigna angularis]|uniref:Uncharacterized protein n=1 Tax=Phaseolus angularis TaxID=3914 RepID=A0A0L9UC07_PHAAN|nr:hypothetical protein LR48_Vigan04g044400 [Vigna angularis]
MGATSIGTWLRGECWRCLIVRCYSWPAGSSSGVSVVVLCWCVFVAFGAEALSFGQTQKASQIVRLGAFGPNPGSLRVPTVRYNTKATTRIKVDATGE